MLPLLSMYVSRVLNVHGGIWRFVTLFLVFSLFLTFYWTENFISFSHHITYRDGWTKLLKWKNEEERSCRVQQGKISFFFLSDFSQCYFSECYNDISIHIWGSGTLKPFHIWMNVSVQERKKKTKSWLFVLSRWDEVEVICIQRTKYCSFWNRPTIFYMRINKLLKPTLVYKRCFKFDLVCWYDSFVQTRNTGKNFSIDYNQRQLS
jgi:hypothetical protein